MVGGIRCTPHADHDARGRSKLAASSAGAARTGNRDLGRSRQADRRIWRMTRYLLDANALSDCIYRRRGVDIKVREARLRGATLGTAIPAAAEVLAGTEFSSTRDRNLPIVERGLRTFRLWPFDMASAREYARIYAELRQLGRPTPTIDLFIAAISRTIGNCRIVSCDSDFSDIPGIRVENWAD